MKIAIIGAGKLGIRLTEALLDGDYDITVVDNNEKKLDILSQQFDVHSTFLSLPLLLTIQIFSLLLLPRFSAARELSPECVNPNT